MCAYCRDESEREWKKCQLRNVPWIGKTSEKSQLECRQSTHPFFSLSFPLHTAVVVISLYEGISPTFTHSHFKLIFPYFLLLAKDSQSPQKNHTYSLSFSFVMKKCKRLITTDPSENSLSDAPPPGKLQPYIQTEN